MKTSCCRYALLASILLAWIVTGCSHKYSSKPYVLSHKRFQATMRPYTVLGVTYRPTKVAIGQQQRGIASWYGPKFHGKLTSSGERYNMYDLTAAHKTWPMNTLVRVHNLDNGRSCVVRINDRGPFVKGRIIDCSFAAGKRLGLDRSGIANVEIEVIGFKPPAYGLKKYAKQKATQRQYPRLSHTKRNNYYIQLGSFSTYDLAQRFAYTHKARFGHRRVMIKQIKSGGAIGRYKVLLGPFATKEEAGRYRDSHAIEGFINTKVSE